jgi:hypothetical protein
MPLRRRVSWLLLSAGVGFLLFAVYLLLNPLEPPAHPKAVFYRREAGEMLLWVGSAFALFGAAVRWGNVLHPQP